MVNETEAVALARAKAGQDGKKVGQLIGARLTSQETRVVWMVVFEDLGTDPDIDFGFAEIVIFIDRETSEASYLRRL